MIRKGLSSPAGRVRALLLAVLTVILAGWLVLSAPAQVVRVTVGHNPDAGLQTADPGLGSGGGGGGG